MRGRVVTYADNNFWIDLTDGKTSTARECREACEQAVEAGVTIFPVAAAGVEELLDQPDEARPRRQAELMDRLSLGVCFRAAHCSWDVEARATLDVYPARAAICSCAPRMMGIEA